MKKNLFLSATALVGMMSMVSCSSEDEMKPQNGKREEVKTSFTLSVGSVKPGTRMTATEAQADATFRGIKEIKLFPFINSGTFDGEEILALSSLHLVDFDAFDHTTTNAKVYSDVKVPVGVNHFVFYGMSKEATNGALTATYPTANSQSKLKDIHFDLVPYNTGMGEIQLQKTAEAILITGLLNKIDEELISAYNNLTSGDPHAGNYLDLINALHLLKAGSSNSVRLFLEKFYNRLQGVEAEDVHKLIAVVGNSDINVLFDVTGDIKSGFSLKWKTDPQFPGKYNLPDGAVALKYQNIGGGSDSKFYYTGTSVDGMNVASPSDYVKPACLAFTVNSPARAHTAIVDYTQPTWDQILGVYTQDAVSLTTQSVVLEKQIQFAVGRLESTVQVTNATDLYDSGSKISGSADENPQIVEVPAEGYQLTGVLIGGQKQVGWNFLPQGSKEYTIYDKALTTSPTYAKKGIATDVNHTLALETATNENVHVCFEFINTGKDFYGVGAAGETCSGDLGARCPRPAHLEPWLGHRGSSGVPHRGGGHLQ